MITGSYRYPITRPKEPRPFDDRQAYLNGKVQPTDFDAEFCQVLERLSHSRWPAPTEDEVEQADHPDVRWTGFSWLTLVLGSGALELPAEAGLTPVSLGRAVRDLLGQQEEWEGQLTTAESFVRSLAEDRLASGASDDDYRALEHTPEMLGVRLALVAALLTRFYHICLSGGGRALTRSGVDVARPDIALPPELEPIVNEVLQHVRQEMNAVGAELRRRPPNDRVVRAIDALLKIVDSGLQTGYGSKGPQVRIDHVRLLTEVAWHYLVLGTGVYPGWTDLLLSLLLGEAEGVVRGSGRLRPRTENLKALSDSVAVLLRPPTEASWKAREPGGSPRSDREHLYDVAAEVLCAQADVLNESKETFEQTHLPPAVAFVTSFDVELDMALWAAGRGFSVAVPVHVLENEDSEEAEFCWLLGEIDPELEMPWDEQREALLRGTRWRVLAPDVTDRELRRRPIVVHLTGCPLFELPAMSQLSHKAGLDSVGDDAVLRSAVMVDEYLALRQSEAEFFWRNQSTGRGLPEILFGGGPAKTPRFWMAVGAQIGDPAVRHRIASQITLRLLREATRARASEETQPKSGWRRRSRTEGPTHIDGVAVNLRIDEDEANLLYWLGLDVVRDDCSRFIPDLQHYAAHLRAGGRRPSLSQPCDLRDGGR